jgi:hypothetical protein
MRHATDAALDRLEPLLEALRAIPELHERKRGVFYRKSQAFLHFHEDPAGLFCDLKNGREFERHRVSTVRERERLARLARRLAEG